MTVPQNSSRVTIQKSIVGTFGSVSTNKIESSLSSAVIV